MKTKQLIKRLRKAGVEITTRKGTSHLMLAYRDKKSTFAYHGGKDVPKTTIKALCKQLGLDPNEVL
jgi:predicted RNA binding protein YcfA (HicA-like mRNA interferase family)